MGKRNRKERQMLKAFEGSVVVLLRIPSTRDLCAENF